MSHRGVTPISIIICGHMLWYVPIYESGCSGMRGILYRYHVFHEGKMHPMADIVEVRIVSGLIGPWFPSCHVSLHDGTWGSGGPCGGPADPHSSTRPPSGSGGTVGYPDECGCSIYWVFFHLLLDVTDSMGIDSSS